MQHPGWKPSQMIEAVHLFHTHHLSIHLLAPFWSVHFKSLSPVTLSCCELSLLLTTSFHQLFFLSMNSRPWDIEMLTLEIYSVISNCRGVNICSLRAYRRSTITHSQNISSVYQSKAASVVQMIFGSRISLWARWTENYMLLMLNEYIAWGFHNF